jgi:hypothetical protein
MHVFTDDTTTLAHPAALSQFSSVVLRLQIEELRVSCEEAKTEAAAAAAASEAWGGGFVDCDEGESWGITELCFQPTPGGGCMVQSALEFWQVRMLNVKR